MKMKKTELVKYSKLLKDAHALASLAWEQLKNDDEARKMYEVARSALDHLEMVSMKMTALSEKREDSHEE